MINFDDKIKKYFSLTKLHSFNIASIIPPINEAQLIYFLSFGTDMNLFTIGSRSII